MPINIMYSPGQSHFRKNTGEGHLYFPAWMLSGGYRKLYVYALWQLRKITKKKPQTQETCYENASCKPSKPIYSASQLNKGFF